MTRCQPGQYILAPFTTTSDRQCGSCEIGVSFSNTVRLTLMGPRDQPELSVRRSTGRLLHCSPRSRADLLNSARWRRRMRPNVSPQACRAACWKKRSLVRCHLSASYSPCTCALAPDLARFCHRVACTEPTLTSDRRCRTCTASAEYFDMVCRPPSEGESYRRSPVCDITCRMSSATLSCLPLPA